MIVRLLNGYYYLMAQQEHARQSAVITAHLQPEFLGPMEEHRDVLVATRHHDDGWAAWEATPRFDDNGLPINFPDIDRGRHLENWERTIFSVLHEHGPGAATIVARHASVFLSSHDEGTEAHHHELIATLRKRAWPGLAEDDAIARLERGFAALFAGDLLSLLACAGWDEPQEFELHRQDGTSLAISAWRDGDWTTRVDPWPFAMQELRNVSIDAVCVSESERYHCREALRRPADHLVRIPVHYLPADSKGSTP